MEPSSFPESNSFLNPPEGVSPEDVSALSVFKGPDHHGNPVVVSCWKLTAEELAEINKTGRVWLGVLGVTMPPVWLTSIHPFGKAEPPGPSDSGPNQFPGGKPSEN